MSAKAKWILLLITFGFLVSTYLTVKFHNPASVVCELGGHCETVLSSKWAVLFGLPVSAWGMAWYAAGFALVYLTFSQKRYPWLYFLVGRSPAWFLVCICLPSKPSKFTLIALGVLAH